MQCRSIHPMINGHLISLSHNRFGTISIDFDTCTCTLNQTISQLAPMQLRFAGWFGWCVYRSAPTAFDCMTANMIIINHLRVIMAWTIQLMRLFHLSSFRHRWNKNLVNNEVDSDAHHTPLKSHKPEKKWIEISLNWLRNYFSRFNGSNDTRKILFLIQ